MHRKDIKGRWWEFTPKETRITKEIPRKQRAYLTDDALILIGDADDGGYVFKGKTDDTRHVTERSISQALRKNLLGYETKKKVAIRKPIPTTASKSKIKFVVPDEKKLDIAHFTPHDLRRTCSTLISELGFTDAVVDSILAHLKKGEIRTYNKNKYDKEKQVAMEEWGLKLTSIITGKEYVDKETAIKRKQQQDIEDLRRENEELKLKLNAIVTQNDNTVISV
jgi:integrase